VASRALDELSQALEEIEALQRANPSPAQGGGLTRPQVTRAIGRAETVLLASHFERFVYSLIGEAAETVVNREIPARRLPEELRLQHSRGVIDRIAMTQWDRRAQGLRSYSLENWQLWSDDASITALDAEALLEWMKTPSCKALRRVFRMWGVHDVFMAITRKPVNRRRLLLSLDELVSKRNNIAHGDLTVEASYSDISRYQAVVKTFCKRSDNRLGYVLSRITDGPRPW
jgi:hypothetical protein